MFDSEDMPLFSGTPMRAHESKFDPKPVQNQLTLGKCRICLDTGKVIVNGYDRFCTCGIGAANHKAGVVSDCRSLSGSTMASLTGLRRYDEIDAIQAEFAEWVKDPERRQFRNWQEAWAEYSENGTHVFESRGD